MFSLRLSASRITPASAPQQIQSPLHPERSKLSNRWWQGCAIWRSARNSLSARERSRFISTTSIRSSASIAAQSSPATPRKRDSCRRAGWLEPWGLHHWFSLPPLTFWVIPGFLRRIIHHRGPEFAEFGESFSQELFTPRPQRLGGAISEPNTPTHHYSNTPVSTFRYISNGREKCIAHSFVFVWDHWHPAPHCEEGLAVSKRDGEDDALS